MEEMTFLQSYQVSTNRNYLERVTVEKPHCCETAKKWGFDYWDGDRKYGYGGYKYDGRWAPIAKSMAQKYGLNKDDTILDIGCGKGFLLYEFTNAVPGIKVEGIDISPYAITDAELHFYRAKKYGHYFEIGNASRLPWANEYFDFVYSINTFHNLNVADLKMAVMEMMRVAKDGSDKYLCIESYRNETEKFNLQNWALTCESFYRPDDWKFLLKEWGYDGDVEFIYFE